MPIRQPDMLRLHPDFLKNSRSLFRIVDDAVRMFLSAEIADRMSAEEMITIAGNDGIRGVAKRFWHHSQEAYPSPARQSRQRGNGRIRSQMDFAIQHHRIGGRIFRIYTKPRCKRSPVG